jgi:putative membrane protein
VRREQRVREKLFIIRISECLIKRTNHEMAKEFRMRRFGVLLLPLCPALLLAACGPNELFGPAAPPPPPLLPTAPPPQSGNMADALALANMETAMINERHALKIALKRASTPTLRAFARKLLQHADAREQQIRELAKQKNITLPTVPKSEPAYVESAVEQAMAISFDQAFLDGTMQQHRDLIAALESTIRTTSDPDIKAFAESILPELRTELQQAEAILAPEGPPA